MRKNLECRKSKKQVFFFFFLKIKKKNTDLVFPPGSFPFKNPIQLSKSLPPPKKIRDNGKNPPCPPLVIFFQGVPFVPKNEKCDSTREESEKKKIFFCLVSGGENAGLNAERSMESFSRRVLVLGGVLFTSVGFEGICISKTRGLGEKRNVLEHLRSSKIVSRRLLVQKIQPLCAAFRSGPVGVLSLSRWGEG